MLCVGKAFLAEHPEYDGMAKDVELFGIALAAMQQEPVAYMTYKGYLLHAGDPKLAEYSEPTPLYDSPPAPVVPDRMTTDPDADVIDPGFVHGWNACRDAMLDSVPFSPPDSSQVVPDWHADAERLAELHGASFVIFRHGEKPVCADPSKFWFGYDPAAPQQK